MKTIIYILVALILISICASSSTIWSTSAYWHPLGSTSWYNFYTNQTDVGYINMTSTSFSTKSQTSGHKDVNLTIYNDGNCSLVAWNESYVNVSLTANVNMSVCGLESNNVFRVLQGSTVLYSGVDSGASGCVLFNITDADFTLIKISGTSCSGGCLDSYSFDITPQSSTHISLSISNRTGLCNISCYSLFLNSTFPTTERDTWDLCPYGIVDGRNLYLGNSSYRINYFNYTVDYTEALCNTEFQVQFNDTLGATSTVLNETIDWSITKWNMPDVSTNVTGLFQWYYSSRVSEDGD